jgi:AcrR family transcriptional regulator
MSVTVITYHRRMGRWEPDARGRLAKAALSLYDERGFEHTTVAEIAARANLTERTFFRHFADKREVLFGGSYALQETMVNAVADAPPSATPLQAAAAGLQAAAEFLPDRDYARRRQRIIAANAELRERELIKLASLTAAFAETLRARGTPEPAASLTGEVAIAVFRTAFEQWIGHGAEETLTELIERLLAQLPALTS